MAFSVRQVSGRFTVTLFPAWADSDVAHWRFAFRCLHLHELLRSQPHQSIFVFFRNASELASCPLWACLTRAAGVVSGSVVAKMSVNGEATGRLQNPADQQRLGIRFSLATFSQSYGERVVLPALRLGLLPPAYFHRSSQLVASYSQTATILAWLRSVFSPSMLLADVPPSSGGCAFPR